MGGGASKAREEKSGISGRVAARINLDPIQAKVSHALQNNITAAENKAGSFRKVGLCQDTRATIQQCLDERTLQVLEKFFKNGVFDQIHGCISTASCATTACSVRSATPTLWR